MCHNVKASTAPKFMKVVANKLTLINEKLETAQRDGLVMFMKETTREKFFQLEDEEDYKLNPNVIKHLIIDNCQMSDDNFAKILEVVIDQRELVELRYNHGQVGPKSIKKVVELLSNETSGIFLRSF